MNQKNGSSKQQTMLRSAAGIVLAGWLVALLLASLQPGIPVPFGWLDVAVVTILCGVPVSWLMVAAAKVRFREQEYVDPLGLALGAVLLAIFQAVVWDMASLEAPVDAIASGGIVTRMLAGLVASLGIAGTLSVFSGESTKNDNTPPINWLFAVLLLVMVPATYQWAKEKANTKTAREYLSQSRLVEARDLLKRCAVLDPHGRIDGAPRETRIVELDAKIQALRDQVAQPLRKDASIPAAITRATYLAMLDRRDEALLLLLPLARSDQFAAAGGQALLGTIYQDRGDWGESLFHFQRAGEFWQPQGESPPKKQALAAALQGQAFAYRKLGNIDQAEAIYTKLLELAPTAQHHFLLAQFYEDIQDTSQAADHARQAIELSPERYQAPAGALLTKMKANHFGCFQLYGD